MTFVIPPEVLQDVLVVVSMAAGLVMGYGYCKARMERMGWQYCSCPQPDCEHCIKVYPAEGAKEAAVDCSCPQRETTDVHE